MIAEILTIKWVYFYCFTLFMNGNEVWVIRFLIILCTKFLFLDIKILHPMQPCGHVAISNAVINYFVVCISKY